MQIFDTSLALLNPNPPTSPPTADVDNQEARPNTDEKLRPTITSGFPDTVEQTPSGTDPGPMGVEQQQGPTPSTPQSEDGKGGVLHATLVDNKHDGNKDDGLASKDGVPIKVEGTIVPSATADIPTMSKQSKSEVSSLDPRADAAAASDSGSRASTDAIAESSMDAESAPVTRVSDSGAMKIDGPKGLKLKGYVINLASDVERYKDFTRHWESSWPGLNIQRVDAIERVEHGLGLTLTYVKALDLARADDADVFFFFEDDAVPFPDVKFPDELYPILESWPIESSTLLLGGHHIHTEEKPNLETHVTKVDRVYGTYAFAVRKQHLSALQKVWADHANDTEENHKAVDLAWQELWKTGPAYIATPLLVDHAHTGVSHTWANEGREAENVENYKRWQGDRQWWTKCVHDNCDHISDYLPVEYADRISSFFNLPLKEPVPKSLSKLDNQNIDHHVETA